MKVFLVAGEPSGDLLGGRLMQALVSAFPPVGAPAAGEGRGEAPETLSFVGVGGPRMMAQGLKSLFPMTDLSLFGVAELIPKIPLVLRRIRETVDAIRREKPDVVVTIDAPDFSFRVAKRLIGSDIPFVHYVAPTVWAWRPGRAKTIRPWFRHLMTLFPFEPPYFEKVGLQATFVGHPLVEAGIENADASRFHERHGLTKDQPLLVVLPGSRRSELRLLLDDFKETVRLVAEKVPHLKVVVPTVPLWEEKVRAHVSSWKGDPVVVSSDQEKYDAFAAGTVALAASGTVALELGLAQIPAVIAYRIHPLTAALYRRFIKVKYVNLVNLMAGRLVVPEYIQENCTPAKLSAAVENLLLSPDACAEQKSTLRLVREWLSPGSVMAPSRKAASVVLAVARKARKMSAAANRSSLPSPNPQR